MRLLFFHSALASVFSPAAAVLYLMVQYVFDLNGWGGN
jgi:hypothetical protein